MPVLHIAGKRDSSVLGTDENPGGKRSRRDADPTAAVTSTEIVCDDTCTVSDSPSPPRAASPSDAGDGVTRDAQDRGPGTAVAVWEPKRPFAAASSGPGPGPVSGSASPLAQTVVSADSPDAARVTITPPPPPPPMAAADGTLAGDVRDFLRTFCVCDDETPLPPPPPPKATAERTVTGDVRQFFRSFYADDF